MRGRPLTSIEAVKEMQRCTFVPIRRCPLATTGGRSLRKHKINLEHKTRGNVFSCCTVVPPEEAVCVQQHCECVSTYYTVSPGARRGTAPGEPPESGCPSLHRWLICWLSCWFRRSPDLRSHPAESQHGENESGRRDYQTN